LRKVRLFAEGWLWSSRKGWGPNRKKNGKRNERGRIVRGYKSEKVRKKRD
jgi:hypothetical protein